MPASTPTRSDLRRHRPYQPRGSALDLLYSKDPEILLSGPAGTGKSRACLEKLHLLAEKYPGLRALIVRRTRASLTESALVTFEEHVVPEGHPCLEGGRRLNRHSYRYPNGSELVCGGLDKPGKVMSAEYDVVYVQEATEVTEDGWEAITTRLRNSTSSIPYKQLLADCNPDRPTHWLKLRCDRGATRLVPCRHEDNPRLHDGKAWTPEGVRYIGALDRLTGPRKLRLRHGRWVRAEGVVYEHWDPAIHLLDARPVPGNWPRIWVVDFGFRNPFVWQNWALDPDGCLYLVREIYHTGRLVEDHARRILELTRNDPPPAVLLCDHDAEDRATLERHLGINTTPAAKAVMPGIEAVAARLRVQANGRAGLYVLRDALDARDPALEEQKKPCSTAEEFDGYIWAQGSQQRPELRKDEPLKQDDHGMDCVRYLCYGLDGAGLAHFDEETTYARA